MAKIYHHINDLLLNKGTIITIGTFDGVHLGHKKILNQLIEKKTQCDLDTLVFTFDPHPRKVLFPEQKDLKLINNTKEKVELLDNLGIDHVLVYPFNKSFSEINPEDYISKILVEQLKAKCIIVGYDHRFGKNREGGLDLLMHFSEKYNYEVVEIKAEDINSINISSTQIRKAIEAGNIELANQFLGYHFFITGKVAEGKKLGRTIGFPTANIVVEEIEKIIPKIGVYAVKVKYNNEVFNGMLNIGVNPTVSSNLKLKMEVHLFDFNSQIYGEELKLSFVCRVRDEQKFSGIDELTQQLKKDKEIIMQLLK
jgi:riboflavin kinase/FMN adenylyltransferase